MKKSETGARVKMNRVSPRAMEPSNFQEKAKGQVVPSSLHFSSSSSRPSRNRGGTDNEKRKRQKIDEEEIRGRACEYTYCSGSSLLSKLHGSLKAEHATIA